MWHHASKEMGSLRRKELGFVARKTVYGSDGSVVSFQKTAVAVLASVVVFLTTAVAVLMRLY